MMDSNVLKYGKFEYVSDQKLNEKLKWREKKPNHCELIQIIEACLKQ